MNYRALLVDFDGTIADETFRVRPAAAAVLRRIQDTVRIGIVTGRIFPGFVARALTQLRLTGPHVLHGGALLYDSLHDRELWSSPMSPSLVRSVVAVVRQHSDEYFVEEGHQLYTPLTDPERIGVTDIPPLPLSETPNRQVLKVTARTGRSIGAAETLRDQLTRQFPELHVIAWYHRHLDRGGVDITTASKFEGVGEWLLHTGVDRRQLVTVGDSHNDFPLLMAGGLKVAMGNAPEELKAIADYVAPSIRDDGIVDVVEKFFLDK